ncbi:class I SAM-dependent methyltransferase [Halocatena pleomorpha]|uniref:Class I SAM-dependent methyltransferase n=1 Tax=Halocatena pleomorpha TaxID=1785090 RepID=A0A3P3RMG2_9EURY|nr:class I SAM-dependent methyltransferase [Halocatena pleomorpha]RRJ34029.1 class I SAM-dependent methyltransferase [Halocatena pleomorpha]
MTTKYTTKEIKRKYNDFASTYNTMERVQELLGLRKLRQRLLQRASGEVLEVACGTDANFPYYLQGCAVTAVNLSPAMVEIAEQRTKTVASDINIQLMDAELLAFPEKSFDSRFDTDALYVPRPYRRARRDEPSLSERWPNTLIRTRAE